MRFRIDIEVGPLRFTFDPDLKDEPDEPDEPGAEPAEQGTGWPLDAATEQAGTQHGPELQVGHRDPFTDEHGRWSEGRVRGRTGFGPYGAR